VWARRLKLKRGANLAAVALANKNARVLWKLLTSGQRYCPLPAPKAERAQAAQGLASDKRAGRRLALRLEHDSKTRDFPAALSNRLRGTAEKSS
jgi:hypothetical protein